MSGRAPAHVVARPAALSLIGWASGLATLAALALVALGFVIGSLFFDDPNASYPVFLAEMAGIAVGIAGFGLACGWGANALYRRGRCTFAYVVALLPLLVFGAATLHVVGRL